MGGAGPSGARFQRGGAESARGGGLRGAVDAREHESVRGVRRRGGRGGGAGVAAYTRRRPRRDGLRAVQPRAGAVGRGGRARVRHCQAIAAAVLVGERAAPRFRPREGGGRGGARHRRHDRARREQLPVLRGVQREAGILLPRRLRRPALVRDRRETADVLAAALPGDSAARAARDRDVHRADAPDQAVAEELAAAHGMPFDGLDARSRPSEVAPITAAFEGLGLGTFGGAARSPSPSCVGAEVAPVKLCGCSGLMLPPLGTPASRSAPTRGGTASPT